MSPESSDRKNFKERTQDDGMLAYGEGISTISVIFCAHA
jgi:hypothetical protein